MPIFPGHAAFSNPWGTDIDQLQCLFPPSASVIVSNEIRCFRKEKQSILVQKTSSSCLCVSHLEANKMLLFWSFGLVGISKKMYFKSTSSQRVHLNKSQRKISFLSLSLVCLPHIDGAPFMLWPFYCYTTENTQSHDWFSCLLRISQRDEFIFLELMTLSGNFLTYISHHVCSIACYLN